MRKIIFLFIIITTGFTVKAQLEVGVFAGGSFYMGDLNPNKPFLQTNVAYGLIGRYNLSGRWAARMHVYQGTIAGDDELSNWIPERSLSFTSGISELAGIMEFHFLPYFNGSLKNYWTPYLFGGVAFLYHKPELDEQELMDFGTEGQNQSGDLPPGFTRDSYSNFVFSIPFGMGFKYSFSKHIAASLEWGMRKTFTDYLDDVSTTYYLSSDRILNPPPGQGVSSEELQNLEYSDPNKNHEALMQRGNSKTTDWYSFFGLTITYHINLTNRNKCSDFQNSYQH
jgi:hypothetical protein